MTSSASANICQENSLYCFSFIMTYFVYYFLHRKMTGSCWKKLERMVKVDRMKSNS